MDPDAYQLGLASRFSPDSGQLQVLLAALLSIGRLVRDADGLRFVLELRLPHAQLAEWTYERLAPLVPRPVRAVGLWRIRSTTHPIFAELAACIGRPAEVRRLLSREGLWVWAAFVRAAACEAEACARCECAPSQAAGAGTASERSKRKRRSWEMARAWSWQTRASLTPSWTPTWRSVSDSS